MGNRVMVRQKSPPQEEALRAGAEKEAGGAWGGAEWFG